MGPNVQAVPGRLCLEEVKERPNSDCRGNKEDDKREDQCDPWGAQGRLSEQGIDGPDDAEDQQRGNQRTRQEADREKAAALSEANQNYDERNRRKRYQEAKRFPLIGTQSDRRHDDGTNSLTPPFSLLILILNDSPAFQ